MMKYIILLMFSFNLYATCDVIDINYESCMLTEFTSIFNAGRFNGLFMVGDYTWTTLGSFLHFSCNNAYAPYCVFDGAIYLPIGNIPPLNYVFAQQCKVLRSIIDLTYDDPKYYPGYIYCEQVRQ